MTRVRTSLLLMSFAWGYFCLMGTARAEEEEPPPVKLTLHPAAEPRPALKYQLLPSFLELIPGNAAVYYGKVTAEKTALFSNHELLEKIETWREVPLEELRNKEVHVPFETYFLDQAARCEYCDWQLPIREEEYYTILLPDAQQTRGFARILATMARIHIARGEFDKAIQRLQAGFAMGRHVAEGETLVNGLVGLAICHMMSDRLLELVQQPGAPNVYWALTMLPRPLIDMRKGMEAEMNAVELSFPELRDLNNPDRSPGEWRDALFRLGKKMSGYADSTALARPEFITAMTIRGYPMVKRALIERGSAAELVEAMPVAQVVLLYTMQTYKDLRDDTFKWLYLPYWEAAEGAKGADDRVQRAAAERIEIIPLATMLVPAVWASHTATVRTDRQIAVLRVIEALRWYAADHGGMLPEKLEDISNVPMPLDPVTGKPFLYERKGNRAYLHGPSLSTTPLNYEITIGKP